MPTLFITVKNSIEINRCQRWNEYRIQSDRITSLMDIIYSTLCKIEPGRKHTWHMIFYFYYKTSNAMPFLFHWIQITKCSLAVFFFTLSIFLFLSIARHVMPLFATLLFIWKIKNEKKESSVQKGLNRLIINIVYYTHIFA